MIEWYCFSLNPKQGDTEVQGSVNAHFRPKKMRSNALSSGLGYIDGIYVSSAPNQNQIISGRMDLYHVSNKLNKELQDKALEELGLTGKSPTEIDRYLDKHEISLPEVGVIDLPTVPKDGWIKLTGSFNDPNTMAISFLGMAQV